MTNNNNQFNNQSANNNFNTIDEETMNYTTRLQNVLAQLEVEKSTNERLHSILDNNKMLKATVIENDAFIKLNVEEFETLLDCYKEENKCLQEQFDAEGNSSLVVETQEEAIALIAKIKGLINPVEVTEGVTEVPAQEIVEDLSEPNDVTCEIQEESKEDNFKSSKRRTRRRTRHRIVLKHKGTSSRPYAVASKEGWKEIIGIYRPTDEQDFMMELAMQGYDDYLNDYLISLDEEEYISFLNMNRDIISKDVKYALEDILASHRQRKAMNTFAEPSVEEYEKELDALYQIPYHTTIATNGLLCLVSADQNTKRMSDYAKSKIRSEIKLGKQRVKELNEEHNLQYCGHKIVAVTDEEFLEVTGEPRPKSKREFKNSLKNNQRLIDYIRSLTLGGMVSFKSSNKDIMNHFNAELIEQIFDSNR